MELHTRSVEWIMSLIPLTKRLLCVWGFPSKSCEPQYHRLMQGMVTPVLSRRKLEFRMVKQFTQGPTAGTVAGFEPRALSQSSVLSGLVLLLEGAVGGW